MQNQIIGVVGRKGSGKSTVLREIVEGAPRLVLWDPLSEHRWCPNRIEDLTRLDEFFWWSRHHNKFAARFVAQSDLEDAFTTIADLVYQRGHVVFGIEEVALISQPNWIPEGFDRLVRIGRHRAIDIVWTTQRAGEVAWRLTAATDIFVLFRHTEPRDIDAIDERCGAEVAGCVNQLGMHDRTVWDALTGKLYEGDLPRFSE